MKLCFKKGKDAVNNNKASPMVCREDAMSNKTGERGYTAKRVLPRVGLQLKSHVRSCLGDSQRPVKHQTQAERELAGQSRVAHCTGTQPTAAPLEVRWPQAAGKSRGASALPSPRGLAAVRRGTAGNSASPKDCLPPAAPTFLRDPGAPSCTSRWTSWRRTGQRRAGQEVRAATAAHGGEGSLRTASPWQPPPEGRSESAPPPFRGLAQRGGAAVRAVRAVRSAPASGEPQGPASGTEAPLGKRPAMVRLLWLPRSLSLWAERWAACLPAAPQPWRCYLCRTGNSLIEVTQLFPWRKTRKLAKPKLFAHSICNLDRYILNWRGAPGVTVRSDNMRLRP